MRAEKRLTFPPELGPFSTSVSTALVARTVNDPPPLLASTFSAPRRVPVVIRGLIVVAQDVITVGSGRS